MNDGVHPPNGLLSRLWSQPYLLLTLPALFWAGNMIAGRLARGNVPPLTLTFLRWALALVILLPLSWRHVKADWPVLKRAWRPILVLTVFGIVAYNSLGYTGLKTTTAINAGLLQAAITPFTVLIALVFFRERPSGPVVAGMALSALGALTVVTQGRPEALIHLHLNVGDLFLLAAVFAYAVYTVWLRRAPKTHPLSILTATFSLGALILIPFVAAEILSGEVVKPTPTALGCILYVGLFPSLAAYFFYNRGVALLGAARASQFLYLIPVFAAVLAVGLLGEVLTPAHFAGAALITAGIVVASLKRKPA